MNVKLFILLINNLYIFSLFSMEHHRNERMKSVLITGSNRGIGLGLVRHLLTNNISLNVIATCRDPSKAEVIVVSIFLFRIFSNDKILYLF